MAAIMASEAKKRRIIIDKENYNARQWVHAILTLCSDMDKSHVTLTPLRIRCCNATASKSTSFSKAFCDTEPYDECHSFGDVFQNGIKILRDYEESKSVPKDNQLLFVFQKLLDFINGDRSINFHNPQKLQSMTETELTVIVANHLLGKLATSSCYLIDKNCCGKRGDHCFCGEDSCKMTGEYGDTSIGNVEVWHGNLDIVINNDLAVEPLDDQPDDSPGGKSAVEVKLKNCLQRNPQIIAQTVVFSFLQKKTHPERDNFLTPCIGIRRTELLVMFYDSEHDVLLESSSVPLFENEFACEFSYEAILVSWLTVNYKFLCNGLVEKDKNHKSNFFVHAKEKLLIYEDKLKFGNVSNAQFNEQKLRLPPPNFNRTPFMRETTKALFDKWFKMEESSTDCASGSTSNE